MTSDQAGEVPAYSIVRDRHGRVGYVGTQSSKVAVKVIGSDGKMFLLSPADVVDVLKAPGEIIREWMLIYSGSLR